MIIIELSNKEKENWKYITRIKTKTAVSFKQIEFQARIIEWLQKIYQLRWAIKSAA